MMMIAAANVVCYLKRIFTKCSNSNLSLSHVFSLSQANTTIVYLYTMMTVIDVQHDDKKKSTILKKLKKLKKCGGFSFSSL